MDGLLCTICKGKKHKHPWFRILATSERIPQWSQFFLFCSRLEVFKGWEEIRSFTYPWLHEEFWQFFIPKKCNANTPNRHCRKVRAWRLFPSRGPFIFFEQYAITSHETLKNLIIAAIAVLVVTSPFLIDCTVTVLVVFNFVALICELFGLMVIWNVSLNSVSMINLVMAIGFAVDYSAHIAHAYVISKQGNSQWASSGCSDYTGCKRFYGR